MIMYNPIICEACEKELQPDDLLVGVNEEGDLIRKCGYCGNEVMVK